MLRRATFVLLDISFIHGNGIAHAHKNAYCRKNRRLSSASAARFKFLISP